MSKFERLLLVLNLIRSRAGIKAPELATETGVSQRTIYRDILSLAAQYPVLYDDGYRMLPTAYLKTMNITRSEYGLLRIALSCPAFERPDLRAKAKSLKAKIDTVVDSNSRSSNGSYVNSCAVTATKEPNLRKLQTICPELERAIENSQVVELLSNPGPKKESESFHPYSLVYHQQEWLLVGYSPLRKDFEALKLSSVSRVSLSNQSFQKDQNFSLQDFFKSRWRLRGGEETVVKVRFTGEAARLVLSTQHHPREKVTKVGENEVIYAVTVKGTEEILKWILSFGPEAEVLAPESLRQQAKQKVKSLSKLYSVGQELRKFPAVAEPAQIYNKT